MTPCVIKDGSWSIDFNWARKKYSKEIKLPQRIYDEIIINAE